MTEHDTKYDVECLGSLSFNGAILEMTITFSDAVASLVPCRFIAIQDIAASCAATSRGGLSVLAKSTIWTCPVLRPGNANSELLLLGHSTHNPDQKNNQNKCNNF